MKACPGLRSGMDVCRHDRWSRHAGVRWNPLALVIPAPQIVIPAKAGIQRGGVGCGNDTRTLPPTNASNFHTLVCRLRPACAIAMKACPGLRSGIDRSSSLSLVIRDIPWSFRPLNSSFRRSKACPVPRYGAGIQRRGRGEGIVALGLVPSLGRAARSRKLHRPAYHHFHPLMRPSQDHGDSRRKRESTH